MGTGAADNSPMLAGVVDHEGGAASTRVDDVLRNVRVARHVLQDFRPLSKSLGWQLSELYWSTTGLRPFIENEVPFVVTSNGRLSEDAAAILVANCLDSPPDGPIVVLELGAGTGLFARYFVDAFRQLSAQAGEDFGDRLVYLVSDRSPLTVDAWETSGLFADCGDRVVTGVCEALTPGAFRPRDGAAMPAAPIRAVICNYALDVLPASVVRQGPGGCEELLIRTSLVNDDRLLAQYTRLTPDEIRAAASSDDPSSLSALLPLISLFQVESAFMPIGAGASPPYADEALSFAPGVPRAIVNHGAVDCIDACLALLDANGFMLVNDYGPVRSDQIGDSTAVQRFGPTTALGLNFPLLDHHFASRGCTVLNPHGDVEWPIHARVFSRGALPRTAEAFRTRFAIETHRAREVPADAARAHRAAGRNDEAVESYRAALATRARDWQLLGEVAEFVGVQLRDFVAGVELARMAVDVNPWFSTWLWNVLGDCLFCQERFEAAHECYVKAHRIDARDARTNLNLAYTLFQAGSNAEALNAIAAGLANDVKGQYRENLLQKQQQIVAANIARWSREQERLARGIPVPQ